MYNYSNVHMTNSDKIKEISIEDFKLLQNTAGVYLIDFWAEWCGPCKAMAPVLENLANTMPEINFLSVDVDNNQEFANQFGITSIPTFYIIRLKGDGTFDITTDVITVLRGAAPALDFKMALENALAAN
jgi:thioredoxin